MNRYLKFIVTLFVCFCFFNITFGDNFEFAVNGVTFTFVMIPGGIYIMGSPEDEVGRANDEIQREVEIAPFLMMQHQVTQGQWKAIMGNNPSYFQDENNDNLPVESVSYNDVQEFITKLNALLDKQNLPSVRLPTEEEWEYAARAGSQTRFPWGDDYGQLATFAWGEHNNTSSTTHDVMTLAANAFGLYDMIGNVWEWTDSFWDESMEERVIRGGSYYLGPLILRSARRHDWDPDDCDDDIGFRLVSNINYAI